nr:YbdD/YjiX family protein [Propionibacterium sp.]
MNAFATSEEPGGVRRPAPRALDDADGRTPWRRAYDGVTRVLKGMAGLDAYERYVRHRLAHHPGEPLQGEAEFWRCRWDQESRTPKARCC